MRQCGNGAAPPFRRDLLMSCSDRQWATSAESASESKIFFFFPVPRSGGHVAIHRQPTGNESPFFPSFHRRIQRIVSIPRIGWSVPSKTNGGHQHRSRSVMDGVLISALQCCRNVIQLKRLIRATRSVLRTARQREREKKTLKNRRSKLIKRIHCPFD